MADTLLYLPGSGGSDRARGKRLVFFYLFITVVLNKVSMCIKPIVNGVFCCCFFFYLWVIQTGTKQTKLKVT